MRMYTFLSNSHSCVSQHNFSKTLITWCRKFGGYLSGNEPIDAPCSCVVPGMASPWRTAWQSQPRGTSDPHFTDICLNHSLRSSRLAEGTGSVV